MPRRRASTAAQLAGPLALPTTEADLIRHRTLEPADLAAVERRRGTTTGSASPCSSASFATRAGETIMTAAERHVARQLTTGLSRARIEALDALLITEPGASTSVLAWARPPPGAPGHRALHRTTPARPLATPPPRHARCHGARYRHAPDQRGCWSV